MHLGHVAESIDQMEIGSVYTDYNGAPVWRVGKGHEVFNMDPDTMLLHIDPSGDVWPIDQDNTEWPVILTIKAT